MATYADLTTEQKAILQDFINLIRPWCGEQARANNHADIINTAYNAQALTLLGLITDGAEVIPQTGGLPGAASLTKNEVITLVSHIQNILSDMSSHTGGFNTTALRQTWSKAAGASSLIG